ncbi:ankyrin repeat-containing domain protein [Plectosphaerella plurivora]|uniref:Ankyrin repeat-containing domain protein n=1 Tax=Plectosphaerella plurivora TaxID=936078 RepID=A0A9P8VMI0_9PEZI|nr:ankyrin repeat-containing domain protein [Plectosphaerella plurivora]
MASLHLAAIFGDANLAEALLKDGAKVDVFDRELGTPLCAAVFGGFDAVAEVLISKGADVNCNTAEGEPLIYFAILQFKKDNNRQHLPEDFPKHGGALPTLRVLLKSGARLDIPGPLGIHPLYLATALGNLAVVKLLLESGTNPTTGTTEGSTPLHIALAAELGPDIIEELVKAGADVNAVNQSGITPLHNATLTGLDDVLQIFLQQRPDLSITDPEGNNLLHCAVSSGNDNVLSMILQQLEGSPGKLGGAALPDVNTPNASGKSPLHRAAARNKVQAAQLLINHGANLDARDAGDMTPLMEAMLAGHTEMMKLLASHGADISAAREFRLVHMKKDDGTRMKAMIHVGVDGPDMNILREILKDVTLSEVVDDNGVRLLESLCIRLSFDAL